MNRIIRHAIVLAVAGFVGATAAGRAQNLDQIGVTVLRAVTTNLNGAGIRVAQPEASAPGFEVNPVAVGQATNLFFYASAAGTATNFPNGAGTESGHANDVGKNFYGMTGTGVATNVAHVDNFDAEYFYENYIVSNLMVLDDPVVNQSFTFGNVTNNVQTNGVYPITVGDQQQLDSLYDDYAESHQTFFVSPANNQYSVSPPGTAYNCICVAAFGGSSSVGPTLDNGRCKPDITAPAGATSFSTPQVAGAAAVLMQAGLRGDGGGDTNAAFDMRTVKALLLNGAVKPLNWTNSDVFPLDARYGAGVLNVFNSYRQLAGGKQNNCVTNLVSLDAGHPPSTATNTIPVNQAWDFGTIISGPTNDAVKHYLFDVSNVTATATATLVWNRHFGQINPAQLVNDLDLYLYRCADSNLVAGSISYVNNVEHLHVTNLPAGRYDLQVVKYGGINIVSSNETYALAWEFVPSPVLTISSDPSPALTWPVYPAGFRVEWTTNLSLPVWNTNQLAAAMITNGQNYLLLNPTNAAQFFRLHQQP